MADEIFDRGYQDGRNALHDGIDKLLARLVAGIAPAFLALRRIQFDAPWQDSR